jgi:hypothetical protein
VTTGTVVDDPRKRVVEIKGGKGIKKSCRKSTVKYKPKIGESRANSQDVGGFITTVINVAVVSLAVAAVVVVGSLLYINAVATVAN